MEVKFFIDNMVVDFDEVIWGVLFGFCRIYGNVELGEFVVKECLKLDLKNVVIYVFFFNIYVEVGKWDMVLWVWIMMCERGICKELGCSWIEVDNKIYDFLVVDLFYLECKEINESKDKVIEKIKVEGYIFDIWLVLKNKNMKDKEFDICFYSEKLVIVYGLMYIFFGNFICVFKNFWVCIDCYGVIKLILKVEG